MSASLLRGLRILEMLTVEPLGVSELARRLDVDKAGVSRVMGALEREGWVARTGSLFVLGERALALVGGPAEAALLVEATRLTGEVHKRTGLTAVALRLAGRAAQPVAGAGLERFEPVRPEARPFSALPLTAGGLALLAQLPDAAVAAHLALDPWPDLGGDGPEDAAAAWELVRLARQTGAVSEREWTVAGLSCLASIWKPAQADRPMALAVLGPVGELAARSDEVWDEVAGLLR